VAVALFGPGVSAQNPNQNQNLTLADVPKVLSPGGNTIGGPGVFVFQPNQRVNVLDMSGSTTGACASVLLISGTVDISVKDGAEVVLEGSIANATPGVGGITAGATACANNVALVEVRCSSSSTEVCRGAWRVDKK
jgi:hypothetical protein